MHHGCIKFLKVQKIIKKIINVYDNKYMLYVLLNSMHEIILKLFSTL